jgi:hypothetical protein
MRRFLIGLAVLAGLLTLALLGLRLQKPEPISTGSLVLPDGSTVRIVGATYGTNHLLGPPVARLAYRISPNIQNVLASLFGRFAALRGSTITPRPALVVWLDRTSTNSTLPPSGYMEAFLADTSGFLSGNGASVFGGLPGPSSLPFYAIPRRDRDITLNFISHTSTGETKNCGSLGLINPLYASYPQWQPEALPASKQVGDVVVTLEKISTGHDHSISARGLEDGGMAVEFGTNRLAGRNNTVCFVHFHSLADSNQVWYVAGEEVSDATGNQVPGTSVGRGSYDQNYFTFEPGLWPSEAAWRLKCEVKRAQGFAPAEMFQFKSVPLGRVGTTNSLGWKTNVNGISVTLDSVARREPNTNSSWSTADLSSASFSISGLTNSLHCDLIAARADLGSNLECVSWESSGNWRKYAYRDIPLEATTVDFTFAVQQSRWVEFTARPEVGFARLESRPEDRK